VKAATATKGVDEELKGLDREITTVERKMDELAVTSAIAGKEVGNVGDKSSKASRDLSQLDRQIDSTRRRVERLGFEFAATGDKVTGQRFGDQQSLLGRLERLRTSLTSLGNDSRPTLSILQNIGNTIGPLAGAAGSGGVGLGGAGAAAAPAAAAGGVGAAPIIGGVVLGLAATLLPTLGAMTAGAVAGTIGTGGVIGGVLMAVKDPVVQSAFQEFTADIEQKIFKSGSAFVVPIEQSLSVLAQDFASLHLDDVFAKAAPDLQIIVQGIGDLVKNLMPGFNLALQRSGPFAAAAAKGFGDLGTALSEFMDNATRSHGSVEGLILLFDALAGTIKFFGAALNTLSTAYHDFVVFAHGVADVVDKSLDFAHLHSDFIHQGVVGLDAMSKAGDTTAKTMFDLGGSFSVVGNAAEDAAAKADQLVKAMVALNKAGDDLIKDATNLEQATIAVAQGWSDLNDQLIRGKGNWDLNTDAGRKNLTLITDQLTKLEQKREADIANGVAADIANAAFQTQADKLFAVATAAGASTTALQLLNDAVAKFAILNATSQLTQTLGGIGSLFSFGGHRAAGGPVQAGMSYVVGENAPELFTPSMNGTISQQWSGGGGGAIVVQNQITLLDPMTGQRTRAILISESTSRGVPSSTAAAAYP